MDKTGYLAYYRKSVKKYFTDKTEEGRIDKNARLEEMEYVLANVFGMSKGEIKEKYSRLYREAH